MNIKESVPGLLTLAVTGFVVGFLIGKHESPDSKKPETARVYIAMYGRWHNLGAGKGEVSLLAGDKTYTYIGGSPSISVQYLAPDAMALRSAPKRDFDSDLEKIATLSIAGTSSVGMVSSILSSAKSAGVSTEFSLTEKIVASIATLGSGFLGYEVGHSKNPDVSEPAFETESSSNLAYWSQVETYWREENLAAVHRGVDVLLKLGRNDISQTQFRDFVYRSCVTRNLPQYRLHPEICSEITQEEVVAELRASPDARYDPNNPD